MIPHDGHAPYSDILEPPGYDGAMEQAIAYRRPDARPYSVETLEWMVRGLTIRIERLER